MSCSLHENVYEKAVVTADVTRRMEIRDNAGFSYHVILTGASSPSGSFVVQASNDNANWEDVSGGTVAISGNATALLNFTDQYYAFTRLKFTLASGSVNAKVMFAAK